MTGARRAMLAIMLLALVVRLWGVGFGLPAATARPDETQIAGPAVGYLSGDLRPPFFQWPTLFQYLVAAAYVLYAVVGRPITGYASLAAFAESRRQSLAPFFYLSRLLSVWFGVMTVWWIFAVGRRAFDTTVGVVSAFFLAVAFLHVRDSHFGVSDVPMTALIVLAVLRILQWQHDGGVWPAVVAGLVSGLAGSTKYNGLGVAVSFAAAWTLRLVDESRSRRRVVSLLLEGAAYSTALCIGFFGTSPYILIDWSRFVADISTVQATLDSGNGLIVGRGWWYYARVVLPAAVGWPVFVAGVGGLLMLVGTRSRQSLVVFAFPVAYYLFAGRGFGVFARYALPLVPFLCLAAAWTLVSLLRALSATWRVVASPYAVAAAAILFATPAIYSTLQLDRLLASTDNRVVVGRALVDTVPSGSFFLQTGESYGHAPIGVDGRPLDIRRVTYDAGADAFDPVAPDWILVQRSPLVLYSTVPPPLERRLAEGYTLERRFPTGNEDVRRLYDQQDAFYLPLNRLGSLERPGPSFELYRKRP